MAKIITFYPRSVGTKFDMDYYCDKFVPFLEELFGEALKGVEVDRGVYGGEPDDPPAFIAIAQYIFDNQEEAVQNWFSNLDKINAERAKFTDIRPIAQITDLKLDKRRAK
ncbi:MAG: EthD family reductase [Syntrophomonadaceae bacterium]|nr:EthD family reductase [Syntrophomonadaceae bacterium]